MFDDADDDDTSTNVDKDQQHDNHQEKSNSTLLTMEMIRPAACGVRSFHNGTEEAMLLYVQRELGNKQQLLLSVPLPDIVLKLVDEFCYHRHWMMHIGDVKGPILKDVVLSLPFSAITTKKRCIVEIGSYCGYSAVLMAGQLQPNDLFISIEINKQCIQWSRRLLSLAGLHNSCIFLQGKVFDVLSELKSILQSNEVTHIDLLFIDHEKKEYLPDLIILEESGLLQVGSIIVADNVLSFGEPKQDYLDHVRDSGKYSSSKCISSTIEYFDERDKVKMPIEDGIEISVYNC